MRICRFIEKETNAKLSHLAVYFDLFFFQALNILFKKKLYEMINFVIENLLWNVSKKKNMFRL